MKYRLYDEKICTPLNANTEDWFDTIVDKCHTLKSREILKITEFGVHGDLTLYITKDENYEGGEDYDLVVICTFRNNAPIDDTGGIYVTDGELWRQLERIWNYRKLSTY